MRKKVPPKSSDSPWARLQSQIKETNSWNSQLNNVIRVAASNSSIASDN